MARKRASGPASPDAATADDRGAVEPLDEAEQEEVIEALRKESDSANAFWGLILIACATGLALACLFFATVQPSFLHLIPEAQLEANGAAIPFVFFLQAAIFLVTAAYIPQFLPSVLDNSLLQPLRPLHALVPPLGAQSLLGSLIPSIFWVLMSVELIRARESGGIKWSGLLSIWSLAFVSPGFAGVCHFARMAMEAVDAEIVSLAKSKYNFKKA